MKVLLTGATGFVGSHILDSLQDRGFDTAVLLRPSSNRRFLEHHLPRVEIRAGAIDDSASLRDAVRDVTHVIHCAGCTKALRLAEFYEVNQHGTRNVVEAINTRHAHIRRLVYISSLAAGGPGSPDHPAREDDPPRPVSEYGRSKLAGEREVTERCQTDYVILRPPGVYGPRDAEFLRLFKAVKSHIVPSLGGGRQWLSLVFAKDLADAAVAALTHERAGRKIFYVAAGEIVTARHLAEEIAAQMKTWTVPLPLPIAFLWLVCAGQEMASRLTGRANVLNRQKYPELRARAWVCDPSNLERELGFKCATKLQQGVSATLAWYREKGWL